MKNKLNFHTAIETNSLAAAVIPRIIRLNVDSLPLSLEPSKLSDIVSNWLLQFLGQRLVKTNDSGIIKGDLALEWEVLNEGKVFRFKLRTGVCFDDGIVLDSHAVKSAIEKARTNSANYSFYLDRITSVETPSADTIIINLDIPMPGFLSVLGEPMFTIAKECGNEICFSGGYSIQKKDQHQLLIKRNSDGQLFQFEEMDFATAKEKFENGNLELLRSYGAGNVAEVLGIKSKNKITFDHAISYFVAFNSSRPDLNSTEKRYELSSALNLKHAAKWLEVSGLRQSNSFMSPGMFPNANEFAKDPHVQSQKKFLKKLKVLVLSSHEIDELAKSIFSEIPSDFHSIDKSEFVAAMRNGDYDAIVIGYSVTLKGIDYLSIFFHSSSLHNLARVKLPVADELVESGWLSNSDEAKREAIESLLQLNHTEKFYIPIAHVPLVFAVADGVEANFDGDKCTTILNLDKIKIVN